ncbi:hypothetical protein ABMA27_010051 [Loxostege sticticalis]|uniref:Reverse transcriptase domain-containing protein n=1 Tax=Loxostege sticticalis TaxID=481309 RepID=A0ABR3H7Q3_LOXSC
MEDIRTASKLLTKDSFMVNIDLKEAYFLLPIHKSHRKYLRFIFNENLYEFSCLPFGLSSAPYIFTKILNPVITELRSKGFLSVRYLDDILCIGRSYNQCVENAKQTIELLTKLGFVINYKKSTLTPNKSCKFLGFVLNSENMTLGLPQNKRSDILERVKSISKLKTISIRDFASFLGKLIAACPAIPYSWVYTKSFERAKYLALLDSGDNYDTTMHIPNSFCDDLRWWKNNILNSNNPIRREKYSMEIFTDASKTDWGAACNNERTGGHWSAEEQVNHINYLELLAVFFGLRSFASDIKDCAILLRVDNTTAISYVNRMGGVQYPHFNDISKKIWQWCEVRRIFIFASYIKSSQNTVADFESRQLNTDTEWELSDNVFSEIIRRYGQPDIDLFATRINAKCEKYISWRRDPYAFNIDAFTVDWHPFFFYAFPPFSLILKILNKLINDGATDFFDISITALLDFLSRCLKSGDSYGTLNNHRSAISLISSNCIGQDLRVKRFFKGAFRLKPSFPRYSVTWNPNIVLEHLSKLYPNDSLSLENITKKCTVLLALATGQRTQTLSLVKLPNITTYNERIVITITDLIKTSGAGRKQPILDLPFFRSNPSICPAATLISYVSPTTAIRPVSETRLLLTHKKPHKAASSQTIGRWIKQTLEESGVDTSVFRPHSTRHAATSAALRTGVNVDTIRRCAGWTGHSTVFANFYNRPLINENTNLLSNLV